jgi:hypothetical protein
MSGSYSPKPYCNGEWWCDICEGPIDTGPRSKWTTEDREVCTECWFAHLSASERKAIAQRVNERRDTRLAEDGGEE